MNNFFATPTDAWGDEAVMLTTTGICITVAVMIGLLVLALCAYKKKHNATFKITTRQLVFSAMAIALASVTSMLKLWEMPMGGSVTLFSMLFIVLIGYWYGPVAGIATGMAYGLLQFVLEPIFYTLPQMLVDYPFAFGALGISGFFTSKKYGLQLGYIAGVLGRFVFAFLSGVLFFAAYAPEEMGAALYSFLYNGSYLAAEAAITLVLLFLPPVQKALRHVRTLATTN